MDAGERHEPGSSSGEYEVIRPTTPWWLWALAIFLTAAVVYAMLDAANAPPPGGVVFPY